MATSRAATPGNKYTDHKGVKRSNKLSCLAQDRLQRVSLQQKPAGVSNDSLPGSDILNENTVRVRRHRLTTDEYPLKVWPW